MSDREIYCDRDITHCYGRDIAGVEEPPIEYEIKKDIEQILTETQSNPPRNASVFNNNKDKYYKSYDRKKVNQDIKNALEKKKNGKAPLIASIISIAFVLFILICAVLQK